MRNRSPTETHQELDVMIMGLCGLNRRKDDQHVFSRDLLLLLHSLPIGINGHSEKLKQSFEH